MSAEESIEKIGNLLDELHHEFDNYFRDVQYEITTIQNFVNDSNVKIEISNGKETWEIHDYDSFFDSAFNHCSNRLKERLNNLEKELKNEH